MSLLANKYSGENQRKENDEYITPFKVVDSSVQYFLEYAKGHLRPGDILDPCAGNGIWGDVLANYIVSPRLVGVDVNKKFDKPEVYDEWHTLDFIRDTHNHNPVGSFDYIISNPPFKDSQEFVEKSITKLKDSGWLVFLLNESFLNSIGRKEQLFSDPWYRPEHVAISSRRVDFTGQGNPHTLVGLFIWRQGKTWETTLNWFDWKKDY